MKLQTKLSWLLFMAHNTHVDMTNLSKFFSN